MPRGSVVSGTVSDELGNPMPGIMVRLMRFQYAQGVRELVPAGGGQTDDRGIYRIWGLDPGEYYVSAVSPNFNGGGPIPLMPGGRGGPFGRGGPPPDVRPSQEIDVGYAPTYYPGVPSVFEATAVTLGLGVMLSVSSSFGQTYGPLAGIVALQIWSLLSAISILYGAAVAAQLEAVRAGEPAVQEPEKLDDDRPAAADEFVTTYN